LETFLKMENITKTYDLNNLKANDDVSFNVLKGEIHALVGENGAGKSTLMKVLYGIEKSDSGKIYINNSEVDISSPIVANKYGIGMVHQHFKLINEFTVAQNVVLGIEPKKGFFLFDNSTAIKAVSEIIEQNDFHILPETKISDLSVGQMQQVEIIKMLYRRTDLLILDEPTSVLTEQEIQMLFETLRSLVKQGKTIIIITHKLAEVKNISDRITIMRKGKVIAVKNTEDVDEHEISKMMVGKSIIFNFEKKEGFCSEPVLRLKDVSVVKKRQKRPLLNKVSFEASTCEIIGITGVAGNGLTELEDVMAGLMFVTDGKIYHNDDDVTGLSAMELRNTGLSYVPTDRLNRGASLETSVKENMIITSHHDFMSKSGVLNSDRIENHAKGLIREYLIDSDENVPIGTLSGGNIQKVILARELERVKDFVLFSEPTWGLDVASSEFIYEKILELREHGVAVILISSNIDEILALADTIMVMYRGRIVMKKEVSPELTREIIGEYMLGVKDDFSHKKKEGEAVEN
jgi:general nucleoside transport system ATP-binding protein